ncbi:DUF4233 domain-containing protein [Krasilnikovia sp. MM14-A1004]|uniref:DUF4233 domain-containing protein n=1 Tax=Krasilnikovia sp. MM14-A1004 TaxID=3373541 RepID=UPI00399CCB21
MTVPPPRGDDAAATDPTSDAAGSPDAVPGGAPRPSGLRNPQAAVRGLGAGTLALEAVVLLLAIQPIRVLGGHLSGWGVGAVVGLAVACVVVAGSMRRSWAWHAGTAIQVLLLACGLLHWSLAVLGLIFGAAWAYATYVRRTILG